MGSAGRMRHVVGGCEEGGELEEAGQHEKKEAGTMNKRPHRLNEVEWEREKDEKW